MDSLQTYLDVLFDGLEGYVYSPKKTDSSWEQNWYEWPRQRAELSSHIQSGGGDIYISPAIYKERRATKDSIKRIQTVWVDFDGMERIDFRDVSIPTLIVQTSFESKVHCYWRVDDNTSTAIEDTSRRLTYYLHADNGGWDATQLLRPPETINYKNQLPVTLVSVEKTHYTLENFQNVPKVSTPAQEYVTAEAIIPVSQVLTNHELPLKLIKMIKREAPQEPYRSSFLARLALELAEEELSHLEIVSCLAVADERIGKYAKRDDQLLRLSQIADYAMHKVIAADEIIVYTAEQILNHVDSLEWILPNWLTTTGQLILSSAPSVGKTQMTFQLAYCLATHERFLGLKAPTRHRVFYMSLEMDVRSLKYILTHQKNEWDETPDFLIIDEGSNLNKYENLISQHEPTVVIVDSMIELFDDENDNPMSEARKVMKWCRKIRRRYGLAIILIHHNRKATEGNKKPKSLSDLAGSYQFAKDSDTVLQLWEDHKGIELSGVKVRFGQKEAFLVSRNENLWFNRVSNEPRPTNSNTSRNPVEPSSGDRHGDQLHRLGGISFFGRAGDQDGPE